MSSLINTRSPYLMDQHSDNEIFRDLKVGLKAVRGRKSANNYNVQSRYLPKFDSEPDNVYWNRLSRSFLTNYFMRTIQSDSGKILANQITIDQDNNDSISPILELWLEDTDLEGKPLSVLAKDQLQMSQCKGLSLAYVDFIADESRPFVKEIDIDDVLSFETNPRTGRLTFLRWQSSIVSDSDEEMIIDSKNVIFEVTPISWKIFDDDDLENPADEGEIVRYKNGSTRITDEIPISLFYTNKQGVMLADSPYRNLAEMTIEHYQVNSDNKNMLMYALQPILFGKDMPDGFTMSSLASYMAIMLEAGSGGENPSLEWVQTDAGPLEQGREQIADIESRISSFGIDANGIRPSGTQTATAKAIDSAGSNAALKMFAEGLAEHLERIIDIMYSYTLQTTDVSVNIAPDFNLSDNNDTSNTAITAFEKRLISSKAATDVLVQNKVLAKDYDYTLDQELIEQGSLESGFM